jgi:hypothetical protein
MATLASYHETRGVFRILVIAFRVGVRASWNEGVTFFLEYFRGLEFHVLYPL